MDIIAAQAMVRFGFSRRPSEPLPSDPQAWLRNQLRQPDPVPADPHAYLLAQAGSTDNAMGSQTEMGGMSEMGGMVGGHGTYPLVQKGAIDAASTTTSPFRERLVWFWANHFTVSLRKPQCQVHIPAFYSETIRPHVTARFDQLVLAVMRSPAMLSYLDNAGSVGPHSRAGADGKHGLNENLGRECMELHTVSPAAGYTQTDVTSMSKVLTGWSVRPRPGGGLQYTFRADAHEPGPKTVMGRTFPEGEQGGVQALTFLANHPATHHHLATKLVTHFVSDNPPPDAVYRIEGVLRDTRGDLTAASEALTALPAAWQPGTKLRSPIDLAIASCRTLEQPFPQNGLQALAQLGQPLWAAPQPNGWPDDTISWAAPEAMVRRVDFAYGMAGEKEVGAPDELAEAVLGPLLRPATLQAIRRAGSRQEAVALLLSSPEFQRR